MQQMTDLEEDQTELKVLVADTSEKFGWNKFIGGNRSFKLRKGKSDPTAFLPPKSNLGGLVRYVKDREIHLTADQARYIYKKVEQDNIVNIGMIKQEIEDDRLHKDNNNKGAEKPY